MRRRDFVLGALGTSAFSSLASVSAAMAHAAAIPYGAAIRIDELERDAGYRDAVLNYCQMVVGEGGLKWSDLRPTRDSFVFDASDRQLGFAEQHGLDMRGHTLVWYGAMPDWTEAIASPQEARNELVGHIETVMGRYKGRIRSWDVVNEPISEEPTRDAPLRNSIWLKHLGRDYIELALRTAAAVAPDAQLVINDYDFEQPTDLGRGKRKAFLDLVRDLKSRDVPLHAVGLQGHLRGEMEVDRSGLTAFVAELAALDLSILVTELDVIDHLLPGPIEERDAIVATRARDYLEAIGAARKPEAVLTWGISDRHTWVPIWFSRDDGQPNRPLPLDADYRPKIMMDVIQDFIRKPS